MLYICCAAPRVFEQASYEEKDPNEMQKQCWQLMNAINERNQ